MGMGTLSAYSRKRIPSPPQKMTTFMEAFSLRSVLRTNRVRATRSRVNLYFRDRHNELAAPVPNECVLLHDFLLEIPRENEQAIRLCAANLIRRIDGDARSGQEFAVLMRIAIDGVVDEVGADGAIIQQGVALARRAVASDVFSAALGLDEEFEQLALGFLHLIGKPGVGFD